MFLRHHVLPALLLHSQQSRMARCTLRMEAVRAEFSGGYDAFQMDVLVTRGPAAK